MKCALGSRRSSNSGLMSRGRAAFVRVSDDFLMFRRLPTLSLSPAVGKPMRRGLVWSRASQSLRARSFRRLASKCSASSWCGCASPAEFVVTDCRILVFVRSSLPAVTASRPDTGRVSVRDEKRAGAKGITFVGPGPRVVIVINCCRSLVAREWLVLYGCSRSSKVGLLSL